MRFQFQRRRQRLHQRTPAAAGRHDRMTLPSLNRRRARATMTSMWQQLALLSMLSVSASATVTTVPHAEAPVYCDPTQHQLCPGTPPTPCPDCGGTRCLCPGAGPPGPPGPPPGPPPGGTNVTCPAFSDAGDPHACSCEITNASGCRGVTPRFNWIIGLCDLPSGVPGVNGSGDAKFPGPGGSFACADPMRLQPNTTAASNVSLYYIAAYQWAAPCEHAIATTCGVVAAHSAAGCSSCVHANRSALLARGCDPETIGVACDSCGLALRGALSRKAGQRSEACSSLPSGSTCRSCARNDPAVQAIAGCSNATRVASLCSRNWTQVPDSSLNTAAAQPAINLSVGNASGLEQAGGAEMWNRGVYKPGVAGLGPAGMMYVISCEYCREFAWYMLNQATLDRGPSAATCKEDLSKQEDNCWASGA
jgi:hypothetical protein